MATARSFRFSFSIIFWLLCSCGSNTPNQLLSTEQTNTDRAKTTKVDDSSGRPPQQSSSQLTWENGANKIFANNCGRCHSEWALNFELFKAKKIKILQSINSKTRPMPPTNTPKWLSEKEKAIEYLSSEELL